MIDLIMSAGGIIALIVGAFFYGGIRKEKQIDIQNENIYKATQGRIQGAIRDADNNGHNWRDGLRERK